MPTKTKKRLNENKDTENTLEETDSDLDIVATKNKKPLEIDDLEPVATTIDEKIEEDPLIPITEEDEAEESVIDGEELNPFGDRWEE